MDRSSLSTSIASIGDLLSDFSLDSAKSTLEAATDVVNGILAENGNATEHMSEADQDLLDNVTKLIEGAIFKELSSAHLADEAALQDKISHVKKCNDDIEKRLAPHGDGNDLGQMNTESFEKQNDLNSALGVVNFKTSANDSAHDALEDHIKNIPDPPICAPLPEPKTKVGMDSFFDSSAYKVYFEYQKGKYDEKVEFWKFTDEELTQANTDYNTKLGVRDAKYCDWSNLLTLGCVAFDTCWTIETNFYNDVLTPQVTDRQKSRIEIKKACDELLHQIKFLLGKVSEQQAPPADTSMYNVDFGTLPTKTDCDKTHLDSPLFVPTPVC